MQQPPEPPVNHVCASLRRRIGAAVLATFVAAWLAVAALGKGGATSTRPRPAPRPSTGHVEPERRRRGLGTPQRAATTRSGDGSDLPRAATSPARPRATTSPGPSQSAQGGPVTTRSHEGARAHRRGLRRPRRVARRRPRGAAGARGGRGPAAPDARRADALRPAARSCAASTPTRARPSPPRPSCGALPPPSPTPARSAAGWSTRPIEPAARNRNARLRKAIRARRRPIPSGAGRRCRSMPRRSRARPASRWTAAGWARAWPPT